MVPLAPPRNDNDQTMKESSRKNLEPVSSERGGNMNFAARNAVSKTILLTLMLFLMLFIRIPLNAEATLLAGNVMSGGELGPLPNLTEKNPVRLRDPIKWEDRLLDVPHLQQAPPKYDLQWKQGPNLSLKNPGRLPGIELGVEMHSFQAWQSFIPEERLPEEMLDSSNQPLLLPPSLNTPDYNGGFLRFTW